MRQTISSVLAAIAVAAASAAPALACGPYGGLCWPCGTGPCVPAAVYVSPAPIFDSSECYAGCGGWAYERLPDPIVQYYFVNQGPTYSGPGNFAPLPTYQESAVSGWDAYRSRPYHHSYNGGRYASATTHYYDGVGLERPAIYTYRARPRFRPSRYGSARRLHSPHIGSAGARHYFDGARAQLLRY
jgi:hypothetical protein